MTPAPTFRELLENLRGAVREISVVELRALLEGPLPPRLIDVREGFSAHPAPPCPRPRSGPSRLLA